LISGGASLATYLDIICGDWCGGAIPVDRLAASSGAPDEEQYQYISRLLSAATTNPEFSGSSTKGLEAAFIPD
jgi:hypothetical protein